jgi:hypothetical protein
MGNNYLGKDFRYLAANYSLNFYLGGCNCPKKPIQHHEQSVPQLFSHFVLALFLVFLARTKGTPVEHAWLLRE